MKLDLEPDNLDGASPQVDALDRAAMTTDDHIGKADKRTAGRQVDHDAMAVVGYATPWSAKPGAGVDLHLSAAKEITRVAITRLDTPQPIELAWEMETLDDAPGPQAFVQGSYLSVCEEGLCKLGGVSKISLELFLTRNEDERILLCCGDWAVMLRNKRIVVCTPEKECMLEGGPPVDTWLDCSLARTDDGVVLSIVANDALAPFSIEERIEGKAFGENFDRLLIGWDGAENRPTLNAKYSNIQLETDIGPVGWTFPTRLPEGAIPSDTLNGKTLLHVHNLPTFCLTSKRWDGSSYDPKQAPSHYDAIHCHDDDMGALDWPVSHRVHVPADADAGVYALQADYDGGAEKIVFFVRSTEVRAPLAFLVPTATYLAYANEFLPEHHFPWKCEDRGHRFAVDNNLRSLYDYHSDLSGVSICSSKKPKTTLRDDYDYPLCGAPHNLPVDLHLLKFCHRNGIAFDLVTDHDLHTEGLACLEGRKAVMTGSHPEYMSIEMEAALRAFAASGGSIAYLGGNGFAATVAIKDDLMELRRSSLEAGRTWDGKVGEQAMALTNEPGGLLRNRGRGEFSLVGGAISLMGFDQSHPFTRTEESRDAECAWLFDGVEEETFGHDGIVLGGAAGYEVDATDRHLGTSADTIVIARAEGFSIEYLQDITRWYEGGLPELFSRRCAEMTIRYLSSGGLIFSASSVAWCGALPAGDEMNDVGRITLNLLQRLSEN